ncbi:MAG: SMP-30/gluconolactonase/LRE family protein [Pirellulales bacterium]
MHINHRHAAVIVLSAAWIGFSAPSFAADHADLPASHTVQPELYATGFEFAEGPALDTKGNLYVVNYRGNGNIGRIAPDGTASVFCDLRKLSPVAGKLPQANGLKIDKNGRLIAADAGTGRLLRISVDAKSVEVLADRCDGQPFNALNDVGLDSVGNIYFSDPGDSDAEKLTGAIYRYALSTGKVTRLAGSLAYPNGLGVTPDKKHLCVSESQKFRMLIYDLADDGRVSNERVLIDFPRKTEGQIVGGKHDPDGLIFDSKGRLYVGMWTAGVINVVEVPSGKLLRQYDAGGSQATNCHFHGPYLYTTVAAKEAVFRLKLGVQGFIYNAAQPGTAR